MSKLGMHTTLLACAIATNQGLAIEPAMLIPPGVLDGAAITAEQHPLSEQLNTAIANSIAAPPIDQTKLTRDDYLRFAEGQARHMRQYQDEQGRIIDPILKKQVQYATPCYAHVMSVLAKSGRVKDAELIESGMRAMDSAVWEMANNRASDNHGDFYTWPAMLALTAFKDIATADRWAWWSEQLTKVDPSKLYNFFNNRESLNWVLVHSAGEFLRHRAGMTPIAYVESMLTKQAHHFTNLGMYAEGGQPPAYDLFSRLFITGMLVRGYDGEHFAQLREWMWRGAWVSALIQSPTGEVPTGYRSSQHIWEEAEQSVIFEAFAAASLNAGHKVNAGIFKRAARLSQRELLSWVRDNGSGYVVKNRFPIEAKHGYEGYSSFTQYNLLACSMAVQAYEAADDSITEAASPADVGGFVLPLLDPFHKLFANTGGNYIEYETQGDTGNLKWTPCGLVRIHLSGANPLLGPSDGVSFAPNKGVDAPDYAVGPAWQDKTGKWIRLASLRPKRPPTIEVIEQSKSKVVFTITYDLPIDPASDVLGTRVVERIAIEPNQVTIDDVITGEGITNIRAYFPALIDDGADKTTIKIDGKSVELKKTNGGAIRFEALDSTSSAIQDTGLKLNARNGIVSPMFIEQAGTTIRYRISTP